ncbi:type VI secretion system membrane subunit TssM [Pseudomonas gingeri NCPPB 3146 = LMG 5327]|uniref:Type VI secretion system membrane subunit TssM n=2 Tax=Pseudomonas gingeri TaxID=117681 RepID=A0A7Y8CCI1_9PSED|nr:MULTISPECIES: type VI secretion system membrane subunit TssM [Pseudomonas]NVZ28953.1 type VI secretion system membrane subunit TssM [Pseudomonas gingeri]NWA07246.1 type VI secretion system membrane subunit TssM [Pseudomonas gingeri]NWC14290.1 type VI secretion system membrane subunit TssM [Pseudomonas gingeri]PNQ93445.1 type VI secretion system membrane subunit TssM [Pseudomonas gingeri NCPPB 3146 = LMG 5327]BBP80222.1 type VI secretion protein IcmF [Pseudomonas sp. Ost2]
MKAFFGFVIRWVIPLLGLIALSLIIWFVGPLLEALVPPGRRWALIILIFAVWIGYRLFRLIQARRQAAKVMQSLAAETAPDPASVATAEELATLRQRMDEALVLLKKAKLGGDERRNLYELPWYVIIGPPGSGKTTALVNSGMHFPLAAQLGAGAIRGVGGTRNCDWWFTDEAVLLDTAGRYTTQDSHAQVDKAAWLGFLDLLKTQRSRRPIDGAFIAISLSDLLLSTDAERAAHATAIRARIQELYTQLGVRFPIYLMLTKLDLVPGFMEFFDALSKEERAQVWGMTFALDDGKNAEGPLLHFKSEFAALEQRLNARLVERLQQERDPARRDLIYGFPQQFGALKECLQSFLDGVFKPNAYEDRALLRGVYFTSGTQEGSPIDRLIGAMAQSMNLDRQQLARQSGTGRSYFIEKLFTAVAFAERGLVGVNPKVERRRKWLARGVLAATVAVVLLVGTLWLVSYRANQAYIAQVDQKVAPLGQSVQNLSPAQRDVLAVLPLLNAVRHLAGDAPGWSEGLGLYQGDMLEAESASVYRKLLIAVFAPRLLTRVEEQLHGGGNSDFLYEGLKAYLMLADNEHYDPEFIKAWIALDWDRSLPRDLPPEQRLALGEHLKALFERRPPNARLDERLIDDLRRQLQQLPVAQRVYDRVKRQKLPEGVPDFRLNEAAGRDAALVFSRKSGKPLGDPLSGFFTARGYREAFLLSSLSQAGTLAEEQWVLGRDQAEQQNVASLAADVRRLYFQDYLRQWDALLADIDFVPITSVAQAADVLRVISGPTSPLKKLLVAVARETDLQQEERLLAAQGKKVDSGVDQIKQRLGSMLGQEQAAGTAPAAAGEDPVSAHFAELNALVNKGEGEPAAIDGLLADMNALYVQVSAMVGASGDALLGEAKNQASAAAARVSLTAERQPPLVQGLVKSVVSSTTNSMMGGVRNQLNAAWTSEVVNVYRQSLSGRYPLASGSARDATLDDFGQFFGVGGVMDNYFRKYLQPYVDTSAATWRWQPGAAQKLGIAPGVLQTFQRAASIRDAFFRSGGTQPIVRFELKPVAMDASITQFLLDLDGQQISYDHGPSRPVAMQWPNPGSIGVVRLSISPPSATGRSGITLDGPWAWFRLLEQSDLDAGNSPDRFNLRLRVDGASISYELRANSAFNPFKSRVLSGFSLPERL